MPLLRVNATASGISMHDTPQAVGSRVAVVQRHQPGAPVIMVHGYNSAPFHPRRCPHRGIFARGERNSWPEALGFNDDTRFGIAFGWMAFGRLSRAAFEAQARGRELADLIRLLRKQCPHHPVHLIAHSLGATLVLAALPYLKSGDIGRIILLAGAAHKHSTEAGLRTCAGAAAELINITSRENDIFDFGFECLVPGGAVVGQGIAAPNAVTIQIDCHQTLSSLAALGHVIAPAVRRICHKSVYTRQGMMALNSCLLERPEILSLNRLKAALPHTPAPRWSRLFPQLGHGGPHCPPLRPRSKPAS